MKAYFVLVLIGMLCLCAAACIAIEPDIADSVLVFDDFEAPELDPGLWRVVVGRDPGNKAQIVQEGHSRKLHVEGMGEAADLPRLDTKTAFPADTPFILEVEVEIPDLKEGGRSYTAVARTDPATPDRPEVWQIRFQYGSVRLAGKRVEDNQWGIIEDRVGGYEVGRTYKVRVESRANGDARFTVICKDSDEVIVHTDWYSFGDQWVTRNIAFRLCIHVHPEDPVRIARFDNLSVKRVDAN
jgi:hypothetical protein